MTFGNISEPLGLSSEELRSIVQNALAEDLGQGDLTTSVTIPQGMGACGTFRSKQNLVVAGLPVAAMVFQVLDSSVRWNPALEDGADVVAGTALANACGPAAPLLAGERVALNFLQHLSGIATYARRLKGELAGTPAEFLDTRKTTPGLRNLQKYAVRVGGGQNHRLRLDDGILIKNNHLQLVGGIRAAVENAKRHRPAGYHIEVEVASLAATRGSARMRRGRRLAG